MSARREPANSVSLFPFLAVLVCAMGALILLLLVMTRRIRQQADARPQAESTVVIAEASLPAPSHSLPAPSHPEPQLTPAVVPPDPPEPPQLQQSQTPALKPSSAWAVPAPDIMRPRPPPIYVDTTWDQRRANQLRQHQEAEQALQRQWQQELATLLTRQSAAQQEVEELQSAITARRREVDLVATSLAQLQTQDAAAANDRREIDRQLADLAARREQVQREIDSVARELQGLLEDRKADTHTRFTIVPFDAASGTTRRPIVIECRADRLIFVSEGITLTAADLDGFIPHFNPLAAGVRSLTDSFERIDGAAQPPYVLLVVRPEGTVSYYVARLFLQSLNLPFGYELVGSSQEFTWSQTEPHAVRACRKAIDEILQDRSMVGQYARLSGKGETPLRLYGRNGEFHLEEVERMRQPGRTVQFGGQQIDRDEHTFSRSKQNSAPVNPRGEAGPQRQPEGSLETGTDDRGGRSSATGITDSEIGPGDSSRVRHATTAPSPDGSRGLSDSTHFSRRNAVSGGSDGGRSSTSGARNGAREPFVWRPRLGSGIGIQRDVRIRVTAESLQVGDQDPTPLPEGTQPQEVNRLLAEELDRLLDAWGAAPKGFYWNPRLEILASADGAANATRLTTAARDWGIDHEVSFERASPAPRAPAIAPQLSQEPQPRR